MVGNEPISVSGLKRKMLEILGRSNSICGETKITKIPDLIFRTRRVGGYINFIERKSKFKSSIGYPIRI